MLERKNLKVGLALDGWRELVMDDSWESLVLVDRDRVNTLSGLVNQWSELGNGPALVLDLREMLPVVWRQR